MEILMLTAVGNLCVLYKSSSKVMIILVFFQGKQPSKCVGSPFFPCSMEGTATWDTFLLLWQGKLRYWERLKSAWLCPLVVTALIGIVQKFNLRMCSAYSGWFFFSFVNYVTDCWRTGFSNYWLVMPGPFIIYFSWILQAISTSALVFCILCPSSCVDACDELF